MRALGFVLIGLAIVLFLAMFTCWGLSIWDGDGRWGSMGALFIFPTFACGFIGGMAVAES